MESSYTIYSNLGLMGHCFIRINAQNKQSSLSLFETVQINGNTNLYPARTEHSNCPISTTDIDIIRNLMQMAVPTLRTNGFTYTAFDANGHGQII